MPTFPVTGDEAADKLLVRNPFALLVGMLLDQQVPMEWAFRGPARLAERLDGELDAATIAALSPEELEAIFKGPPAVHRFPGSMAKRTHALAQHIVEHYDGDASKVWRRVGSGDELLARFNALPGFGKEKAQIFLALLAKRMGVKPQGWEAAAGPFADAEPRSVADVSSREKFAEVREWKKRQKAMGKSKSE